LTFLSSSSHIPITAFLSSSLDQITTAPLGLRCAYDSLNPATSLSNRLHQSINQYLLPHPIPRRTGYRVPLQISRSASFASISSFFVVFHFVCPSSKTFSLLCTMYYIPSSIVFRLDFSTFFSFNFSVFVFVSCLLHLDTLHSYPPKRPTIHARYDTRLRTLDATFHDPNLLRFSPTTWSSLDSSFHV